MDVFSFSDKLPFRIEFFGDEIESLRTFEIDSQISNNTFLSIEILADLENKESLQERESIFNFLSPNCSIITENELFVQQELDDYFKL